MPLTLHTITLDPSNAKTLKLIERYAPNAASSIDARIKKAVNKLGIAALQAYQSKVPIHTGYLRNSAIQIQFAQGGGLAARVYVSDSGHPMSVVSNATLAQILDNGQSARGHELRRTQVSMAVDPYSPIGARSQTAGWIQSARNAFNSVRGRLSV